MERLERELAAMTIQCELEHKANTPLLEEVSKLRAELAAMTAEVEILQNNVESLERDKATISAAFNSANDECAELRKDAERYRWLRSFGIGNKPWPQELSSQVFTNDDFDEAINAAMEKP